MWLSKGSGKSLALRWVRDEQGKIATRTKRVTYSNGKTIQVRQPLIEVFAPKSAAQVDSGTSKAGAVSFAMKLKDRLIRESGEFSWPSAPRARASSLLREARGAEQIGIRRDSQCFVGFSTVARHSGFRSLLASDSARRTPPASKSFA